MKVCPKCGYEEDYVWRPARWDNPDGEVEVCKISDFEEINKTLADDLKSNRGIVSLDIYFAYLLTKKGSYVKRVRRRFYESGGISAFKVPWQWGKYRIVRDASGYREQLPLLEGIEKKATKQ